MDMQITQPSKKDRMIANESFRLLQSSLEKLKSDNPEIEIEETGEKVKIPLNAFKLLVQILGEMREGKPISLVPIASELTTQAAAEMLNCSRPHVVKLLEDGVIPFTKVGRHRRIKLVDLQRFQLKSREESKARLIEMMSDAEELGLYDS